MSDNDNLMYDSNNALRQTNKFVLINNALLTVFLIVGYLIEYFKGNREIGYVIHFIIIATVPILVAIINYRINPCSMKLKGIMLIGYFIVYIFAMLTSRRLIVYVYLFPIITMYFLYLDIRLMIAACSMAFAANVAKIAYMIFYIDLNDKSTITDFTVQFSSVALFSFALIISTYLSNKFNDEKLNSIRAQKDKQAEILSNVLKAAGILEKNSASLTDYASEFDRSIHATTSAIGEIAAGAQNTSVNMEKQSELSKEIQSLIMETSELSNEMEKVSNSSKLSVQSGLDIVEELNNKAFEVNEKSMNVYDSMLNLKKQSEQVLGIIEIIADIAEQTNLLSLNAAIESARAGDAGKGFGVVADEIRKLSAKSKESTAEISRIINGLKEKVDGCLEDVVKMKEANDIQHKYILETKKVFGDITNNIGVLTKDVELVDSKIDNIVKANEKIVESINEITAISQQTAANAEEANAMSVTNLDKSKNMRERVKELLNISEEMRKYSL